MQQISPIKERILQYIEKKGISKYKFYQDSGITRGVLDKDSGISEDNIAKFIAYDPSISIEWLLTGKGEQILNRENIEANEDSEKYDAIIKVPYYDIDFTASFLEIHNDHKSIPDHYVSHPFFQGCDYIVRASGQSMAKVIKHGDAIGLVEIKNWQEFIPLGEIYAIVTRNNFRMIKIITKGEDKSSFTLISKPMDGKKDEFPPQQIKRDQILSIFRVQASSHLF